MTPERWQRINEVFHAALDCAADECEGFLAEACAGDAELRAEVESLLAAHTQPGDFIDAPAYEAAAELVVQAHARSLVGTRLGAYRVFDQLGAGGMGEVYLAEDTRLGRRVALKLLPAAFTSDPDRLRRFQREARVTSALNHPNIVTIYEVGEASTEFGGLHFIATEFVEGQTLRQWLAGGWRGLGAVLDIATQIAGALTGAHMAGVMHRDIKPENVMVRPDGLVKVLDFGLAKHTDRLPVGEDRATAGESVRTSPGVVMGTFNYMSPEQARGLTVDARTDIFSLGVLVHELITGQSPFAGATPSDVIAAILTYTPPSLQQYYAEVPAELQRIVAKALRKDREERYQSSKELLADLQSLKQEWEFNARLADSGASAASKRAQDSGASSATITDRSEASASGPHTVAASVGGAITWRKRGLALAALLLTVTAGTLYWRGGLVPPATPATPPRVVPVTTLAGGEDLPAFSPDGNQLAFVWDGERGDNKDIYVKLIGAGAPLRLTSDPAEDSHPAWSPDGTHVAFIRHTANENGIFLIPALGGVERKVGQTAPNTSGLAWSPDGKLLAFTDQGQSLYLLSLDTLEKRRLTSPPTAFGDSQPAFSPDGQYLAFVRMGNTTNRGVYLQPMSGGESRQLTKDDPLISGLAWMADSRAVVFSSNRAGSFNLWRVAITGGAPEVVSVAGKGVYNPAISRQGNRLAYNERFLDSNIWRLEASGAPDGGATARRSTATRLISSTRADHSPQFSPDGRKIAFVSDRSGSDEIWVSASDGTNPMQLTYFNGAATGSPRWSPDSRWIVFDSLPAGHADIFIISTEGGQPRALTTEKSYDILPSFSHDGRWVYFRTNRGGSWQIWRRPAGGGLATPVTRQGAFEAVESPAGRLLYYTKDLGPGGLWQVPVEGGEETAVPELSKAGYWRYWAVHTEGIHFLSYEASAAPVIKFFSFATHKVTTVITLGGAPLADLPGLCLSPDRRWLLYAQADQSISDLMLIENFR
jgi:eukaryotic-like serine/threonine-protein kinase